MVVVDKGVMLVDKRLIIWEVVSAVVWIFLEVEDKCDAVVTVTKYGLLSSILAIIEILFFLYLLQNFPAT